MKLLINIKGVKNKVKFQCFLNQSLNEKFMKYNISWKYF